MLALDTLCEPVTENGVFRYRKASNFVNACIKVDRLLHQDFWRQPVLRPTAESALTGPILDDVAYPNVLVAKAISDGRDLRLVLYPGAGPGTHNLELARLHPHRDYRVTTDTGEHSVIADSDGRAQISVTLDGRTAVRIRP